MNLGGPSSLLLGSLSSLGSRLGFGGGWSLGVGIWRFREERARPRWGWEGMVPAWVWRVRVVLKPVVLFPFV